MNFENAELIKDWIWVDGPLLSQFEVDGRMYLVSWVDVTDEHVWLIIEVSDEALERYRTKQVTLLELEQQAPNLYTFKKNWVENEPQRISFDDVPLEWRPTPASYYDEDYFGEDAK